MRRLKRHDKKHGLSDARRSDCRAGVTLQGFSEAYSRRAVSRRIGWNATDRLQVFFALKARRLVQEYVGFVKIRMKNFRLRRVLYSCRLDKYLKLDEGFPS
jgi:hypothetical protein